MRAELKPLRAYNKYLMKVLVDSGFHRGSVYIRLEKALKKNWRHLYQYKETLEDVANSITHYLGIKIGQI